MENFHFLCSERSSKHAEVIKKVASFSVAETELKTILKHQQWHKECLNLRLIAYGWYIIEKMQWNFK